jgi:cytochrome c5
MKQSLIIVLAMAAVTVRATVAAAEPDAKFIERGRKVYVSKCARCHKFYDPNKYDDATWQMWMGKMKTKSRLKDDDYQMLEAYVNTIRSPSSVNQHSETDQP